MMLIGRALLQAGAGGSDVAGNLGLEEFGRGEFLFGTELTEKH
jgi:hypothetical protein